MKEFKRLKEVAGRAAGRGKGGLQIRDRIKELRRVKASKLLRNPKNWRLHPRPQTQTMLGILAEIGCADALLARELPDGSLMLIDGHLRADVMPDMEVPVLIVRSQRRGGRQTVAHARSLGKSGRSGLRASCGPAIHGEQR